ncbi:MAG: HAD-IA family hydrolase [archaeon]|jgi:HAD superfamily hydrolase (TIGR01509 family)
MIKAVFLDYEGVVTAEWSIVHAHLFPKVSDFLSYEELKKRYDLGKRGKLTFEEFVKGIPPEKRFLHMKMVRYRKGSKEAIKNLRKKFHLYVASNHLEVYFDKEVEKMKSKKYFRKLFVSNELKCAKPDKEFFDKILKLSGEKSEESIFVDDAKRNLIAAKQSGFVTIWVNNKATNDIRNHLEFTPDYEITDLRELEKIIEKINSKK